MIQQEVVELEREIAEAAYDVEYVIECLALDPVLVKSGYKRGKHSSKLFSDDEMIQIMTKFLSLREKAMEIIDVKVVTSEGDQQLTRSLRPGAINVLNRMIGFDDHMAEVRRLITQIEGGREILILPMVGIGGIGKTTLIRNVFDRIKSIFEISIWCTISQSPDLQSVLSSFLNDLGINVDDGKTNPGEKLHSRLYGKRYLIVLDDILGIDVWDTIKSFFPVHNCNYGRIIITIRMLSVASYIGTCKPYELRLLDEETSWSLLREKVFATDLYPPELEHIGMQITRDCRGLPLVIVVIAGQLMTNNMTRDSWERVATRLRLVEDVEGEEWCLQILSYCYECLPVHLKPCLLYMAVFPEDHSIQVPLLIKMWVAEGFLKPNGDQCLEDVAMEYLLGLVQRNLIFATELSSTGKITYFQIHDFLRDLCLKKAYEYNFLRSRTNLNLGILPKESHFCY